MGLRIFLGREAGCDSVSEDAVLFCSTTGVAFGPIINDDGDHDAIDRMEAFLRFMKSDPRVLESDARRLSEGDLQNAYSLWLSQEEAQWAAEEAAAKAQEAEEEARLDEEDARHRERVARLIADMNLPVDEEQDRLLRAKEWHERMAATMKKEGR